MLTQKITPSRTSGALRVAALLFCLLTCHVNILNAQPDSLLLRDYTFIQQQDPWLTHPNAAALTRFSTRNIADAQLSLSFGRGGLTEYYGSPKVLQAGAAIESYYRISPRAVVFGHISYDNWTGRDMTGSAFTHLTPQQRYAFDIVEDSLTNSGRKHRDTYRLTGGVGVDVWHGYAIGARVDYTAANYAKYKDLRHQNKLMDLTATASVYAPVLPWLSIGAGYTYHRQTESVTFSTYGKSEKVYKSLIDYGAFMGIVEQLGSEGYTEKSREMPLFEDAHGGSLQVEVRALPYLTFYADASLNHGKGYYGKESLYTITYMKHQRDIFTAHGRISYQQADGQHLLDLTYRREKLNNKVNTYRALKDENEVQYYLYSDAADASNKKWHDFDLGYTAHLGIRGEQPTWTLTAAYHWQQRTTAAYLFPYYRYQHLTTRDYTASITRHFLWSRGILSVSAHGGFREGSGEPYADGAFTTAGNQSATANQGTSATAHGTSATAQGAPDTMEAFLYQDWHLLTAPQYHIGLQVKYAFRCPGTRLKTYVATGIQYRKANGQRNGYCGRDYTSGTFTLGCSF